MCLPINYCLSELESNSPPLDDVEVIGANADELKVENWFPTDWSPQLH